MRRRKWSKNLQRFSVLCAEYVEVSQECTDGRFPSRDLLKKEARLGGKLDILDDKMSEAERFIAQKMFMTMSHAS